jgi:hypothetical protein
VPKVARIVLAVVLGVAAVVGVLLFVQSRDKSTFGDNEGGPAPGRLLPDQGAAHHAPPAGFQFATNPPASGPHVPTPVRHDGTVTRDQLLTALEQGNIVFVYDGNRADESQLRAVQEDVAGPFDPTLAIAGQAVILDPRRGTKGVIALAWRRMLTAPKGSDPKLRAFADAYLGKGVEK